MQPSDFDDFDEDEEQEFDGTITPDLKHTIRKMIREAIKWQNRQVLFTCRQCCFFQENKHGVRHCNLDRKNELVLAKRQPTQMPDCFTFDPLMSAFAGTLTLMHSLGIDPFNVEYGWLTIVGRIAQRADRFGYVTGVKQKNLDKYGA
jgi:hypothetical protein